jgi:hypothetical protein
VQSSAGVLPWRVCVVGIENILCESQKAPPSSVLTDRGPDALEESKLRVHHGAEKDFPALHGSEFREGFFAPERFPSATRGSAPYGSHPANVEAKDAFIGRFLPDGKDAQSADESKSDAVRIGDPDTNRVRGFVVSPVTLAGRDLCGVWLFCHRSIPLPVGPGARSRTWTNCGSSRMDLNDVTSNSRFEGRSDNLHDLNMDRPQDGFEHFCTIPCQKVKAILPSSKMSLTDSIDHAVTHQPKQLIKSPRTSQKGRGMVPGRGRESRQ